MFEEDWSWRIHGSWKQGSYPSASPVLLPERFRISTGEIL